MIKRNRIVPCLWFDTQAEAAAELYVSIFNDSGIDSVARYGKEGFEHHGRPEGSVMTVAFHLDGQDMVALNGGPLFKFSEAISLQIYCDTQQEVDHFWSRLSEGGEEGQCGWLKDRFGLSWQVVPAAMLDMLRAPEPARLERVTRAMFQMQKLDLALLERAYTDG